MAKTEIPAVGCSGGLDIGNGDLKIKIKYDKDNPVILSAPSCVAYNSSSNTPKIPTAPYIKDLLNNLDAEVVGPGIKPMDEGRVFFGRRAIDSGLSLTMFNISNHVPKSQDSLSTILIDGIIASTGVTYWYEHHSNLPHELNIAAGIGIALPIDDYRDYRESYKEHLMSKNHMVTIRNFEKPIIVNIHYSSVMILAEGAAANYAIEKLGPKFLQAALDKARQDGDNINPAYTGQLLAKAKNTIGLDLGDGTVNVPVLTNGRINTEASSSINVGYGTMLDEVLKDLQNTTASFESRRDLAEFLRDKNNQIMPAQKATYEQAQRAVNKHKPILVRDIRTLFTNIFRRVGRRTEVIFVYGGAATPMKDALEPVLIEETKVGGGENIPMLWMDSQYSRYLNMNGLYDAALYGVQSQLV